MLDTHPPLEPRRLHKAPLTVAILIAGMLPLGIAMEKTGTAQLMAEWIVALIGNWGALAVLAASNSFLMPIGHQVNVIIFGP